MAGMCAPRFVSVLVRCIDCRWWVVEGADGGDPSQRYFLNHGRDFPTREQAFEYGEVLAGELGLDETTILEVQGDRD